MQLGSYAATHATRNPNASLYTEGRVNAANAMQIAQDHRPLRPQRPGHIRRHALMVRDAALQARGVAQLHTTNFINHTTTSRGRLRLQLVAPAPRRRRGRTPVAVGRVRGAVPVLAADRPGADLWRDASEMLWSVHIRLCAKTAPVRLGACADEMRPDTNGNLPEPADSTSEMTGPPRSSHATAATRISQPPDREKTIGIPLATCLAHGKADVTARCARVTRTRDTRPSITRTDLCVLVPLRDAGSAAFAARSSARSTFGSW